MILDIFFNGPVEIERFRFQMTNPFPVINTPRKPWFSRACNHIFGIIWDHSGGVKNMRGVGCREALGDLPVGIEAPGFLW